jgi:alpha-galactosidase
MLTLTLHVYLQVWAGPLSGNRLAVALWNRCSKATNITASWEALGLESGIHVSVRDLWQVINLVYLRENALSNLIICCIKGLVISKMFLFFTILQHKVINVDAVSSISAQVDSHASELYILTPSTASYSVQ